MKSSFILLTLLLLCNLANAKLLISPKEAMQENFPQSTQIIKKQISLSAKELKEIQNKAHVKLRKKSYTLFIARKDDKNIGYGILINKKVRSKNGVILYLIADDKLQGIEIIAFNEPQEYLPNKKWQEQFQNRQTDQMLHLTKEIPTITGATLSAKSIVESSRIAFALYNTKIKGK